MRPPLPELYYDLAVVLAFFQKPVRFDRAIQREDLADLGSEFAVRDPFGKLLPCGIHDFGLLREVGQPQPLQAGGFGVQGANVELRWFAGRGAVLDDASEI